jgi:hypothetical protein
MRKAAQEEDKTGKAKAIAELKRREEAKAAFIKQHFDPARQRYTLDIYGANLIELASEICTDAVDKGKPKVARKVEGAISKIHDALDTLRGALDELAK